MKTLTSHRLDTLIRVVEIGADLIALLKPQARNLLAQIQAKRDAILWRASMQDGGQRGFYAGVEDRRRAAAKLRERLVEIAAVARSLDREQFPLAGELIRVTRSQRYNELRANAGTFLKAVTPIQQAYIDLGFPEDFVAELKERIGALDKAANRKYVGLCKMVESTASLDLQAREGLKLVRALDAILTPLLKKTNPALLAAWKSAAHVQRGRRRAEELVAAPASEPMNLETRGAGPHDRIARSDSDGLRIEKSVIQQTTSPCGTGPSAANPAPLYGKCNCRGNTGCELAVSR